MLLQIFSMTIIVITFKFFSKKKSANTNTIADKPMLWWVEETYWDAIVNNIILDKRILRKKQKGEYAFKMSDINNWLQHITNSNLWIINESYTKQKAH